MGNLKVKCGDCILIRVRENTDGIDDYNIARLLSCHDASESFIYKFILVVNKLKVVFLR